MSASRIFGNHKGLPRGWCESSKMKVNRPNQMHTFEVGHLCTVSRNLDSHRESKKTILNFLLW